MVRTVSRVSILGFSIALLLQAPGISAGAASSPRSTGSSWLEPVSAFPTNTIEGVSCPSSTTCFALGTYDNDQSVVYGSEDGGATWSGKVGPSAAYPDVAIACPTTTFCVVEEFGPSGDSFAVTRDGGASWHQAADAGLGPNPSISEFGCPSYDFCEGVEGATAVPTPGGGLGVEGGEVVSTTDGGQAWRRHPASTGAISVSCLGVRSCYVLKSNNAEGTASLFSSANRGGSLHLLGRVPATNPEFEPGVESLACTTPSFCALVLGSGRVLVTVNAGRHWTAQPAPFAGVQTVTLSCAAPSTCTVLAGSETQDTSIVTTNGTDWSHVAFPGDVGYEPSIDCSATFTCFASTQTSSIEELSGSTSTWTSQPIAAGIPLLEVAACDPDGGCLADGDGSQATSVDDGSNWSLQSDPSLSGDVFTSLVCPAVQTCLAAGYSGPTASESPVLLVTSDLGQSWQDASLPSGVSAVSSVTCATSNVCLAVQPDQASDPPEILRTTDGGLLWSWVAVTDPGLNGTVVQVDCATTTDCALVGAYGWPASYSATSTDAGATWTTNLEPVGSDTGLGGIACTSALDCASTGIVKGGGLGQWITTDFASTDGGDTWTESGALDAYITACGATGCWASSPVFENPLSPLPKQSLYESTNLGQDWTLFATPSDVNLANVVGFTSDGAPIAVGENVHSGAVILVLAT